MPELTNRPLRYRQIHLDFHTSEHIPDVGVAFDPDDFVATFKAAKVDSVTIFAKCHHGWSYYPTEVGEPHPNLSRPDLLGDMVAALSAADIDCPIYISVQWDERNARLHPEWRARSATPNRFDPAQLQAGWHTLCLNHEPYRRELLEQAREVARRYPTQGLFFDIVLATDCVCAECLATMQAHGLDPERPEDRLKNDEWVNERFRSENSAALREEFPDLRLFYNCGHIHKQGPQRFAAYSHLELESLPTGGWGYDHFPSSARYAATLGFDFVAHTGKFHTSWGEFGGFKHQDALEFECAQMVALGSKCLVGDQLHPSGAINRDTYKSIAAAYSRIARLEPFLEGARQVSEIAILSAEHFSPSGDRNHTSDDGAAQMLQELKLPFDVIDRSADFAAYRLLILPDTIGLDGETAERLASYLGSGGRAILTDRSGLDATGRPLAPLDLGFSATGARHGFEPTFIVADPAALPGLTETPFVMYGKARAITATGATIVAEIVPPYFNRSYKHFSSHQHAPDNPQAPRLGPAIAEHNGRAYVAYPIFQMYHAVGQPLYKYLVRDLIERLMPNPVIRTDLSSSGRASLSLQAERRRHILHLLFAAPTVRGKEVPTFDGRTRPMEMIEDIQSIGPVRTSVRLPHAPSRTYDALSGAEIAVVDEGNGYYAVTLPSLRIHAAIVFEGTG